MERRASTRTIRQTDDVIVIGHLREFDRDSLNAIGERAQGWKRSESTKSDAIERLRRQNLRYGQLAVEEIERLRAAFPSERFFDATVEEEAQEGPTAITSSSIDMEPGGMTILQAFRQAIQEAARPHVAGAFYANFAIDEQGRTGQLGLQYNPRFQQLIIQRVDLDRSHVGGPRDVVRRAAETLLQDPIVPGAVVNSVKIESIQSPRWFRRLIERGWSGAGEGFRPESFYAGEDAEEGDQLHAYLFRPGYSPVSRTALRMY